MKDDDDSYEIIPHQLLSDLKSEVAVLKEKLMGPDVATHELVETMLGLKQSLSTFQSVFEQVVKEVKTEEEEINLGREIKDIKDALREVSDQNQQIARGLVALADMVEKLRRQPPARPMPVPQPRPAQPPLARVIPVPKRPMGPPPGPMGPPMGAAPPMMPPPGMQGMGEPFANVSGGMPPPPPPPAPRPGLMGKLFKK